MGIILSNTHSAKGDSTESYGQLFCAHSFVYIFWEKKFFEKAAAEIDEVGEIDPGPCHKTKNH